MTQAMTLRCPDCKQPLQSTIYEDVHVHFCRQCKGFFLGKNHLQQIVKIRDAVIPRDSRPPARRAAETTRKCPQCQVPMKKGKYGKVSTTTFDLCEPCASLWLDQGEIDSIQLDYEMVSDNMARSKKLAAKTPVQPTAGLAQAREQSAPAADSGFQCPKCGHAQTRGAACSKCGIIFAKYEALQQERAAQEAGAAAQTAKVEQVLARISGFEVQQQYHLAEALIGFERANRYQLQPVPASATRGNWQIEETNRSGLSILGRNLLGPLYTFTMNVLDENRNRVLQLQRRARFYFMHLDIFDENGRLIGAARRRFSWLNRVVSVHDDQGRELLKIIGPLHRPWTFLLRQTGCDAGSIEKRWTGMLKEAYTDADRFTLRLSGELDNRCKRLVLGATMLIDSLYFEGRRPFIGHFLGAPGVQILLLALLAGALLMAGEMKLPGH